MGRAVAIALVAVLGCSAHDAPSPDAAVASIPPGFPEQLSKNDEFPHCDSKPAGEKAVILGDPLTTCS